MGDSSLLHINVDKETKEGIQFLIDIGFFSTESEIAREAIRYLMFDIGDGP